MKELALALVFVSAAIGNLLAQVCDPSVAPTGLTSIYTSGTGALLEWDAIPGSIGVQIKATSPSGSIVTRRIIGFERDQFLLPEAMLTAGTYTWQVQAACSSIPPYSVTPISTSNNFTVGSGSSCPATVTDIDGNVYSTVEINGQCWMAENLKVERYRNGDSIPTGLTNSVWSSTTSGAFAVYNNSVANKAAYGLLYNWFAVDDAKGLCPSGWHVPTDEEWTELSNYLGGDIVAGGKMKATGTLGAGTGLWQAPNTGATNSSGFSGLPGGYRYFYGVFNNVRGVGYWWSSSESSPDGARNRELYYNARVAYRAGNVKQNGFSVRCLLD